MNDCQMCGGSHEPDADCDRATREAVQKSLDLIRALHVVALSNEERMKLLAYEGPATEALWFLEHVDELAPELHRRGWVEHAPFTHTPGEVTVTGACGSLRALVVTELGKKQLNAAVVP